MRYLRYILPASLLWLLALSPVQAADFKVVASIKPIHSLLSALMQGTETPTLLIEDGTLPYDFIPTEQHQQLLTDANLVIWIGPELETSLASALSAIPESETHQQIAALDIPDLKILPAQFDDSSRDPFFWLDSRNALILVNTLTRILSNADPQRAHLYQRNRQQVYADIAKLDKELEYGYRGLQGATALTYYDILQYFSQAYALKTATSVTDSPRQSPAVKRLLTANQAIAAGEIQCLLTDRSYRGHDQSLLQPNAQLRTGELDTFGRHLDAGPQLYQQLMEYNTRIIQACVSGEVPSEKDIAERIKQVVADTGQSRFLLLDHMGKLVTDRDMKGDYHLIYFGYTSCPDVCPISLQTLMMALGELGDQSRLLKTYFITVDPKRDRPDVMRRYVEYFGNRIIGLVGTQAMTDSVTKHYNVFYQKVITDPDNPDNYQMDHTASIYVIDPDGRYITKLAHGTPAKEMVAKLKEAIPLLK